jgi:hypothetical protein
MAKVAPASAYAAPEEVSAPGPKPPKLDGAAMFLFTHHRMAWQVRGGRLVPRLGRQRLIPGVNLIRKVGKRWDLSAFRTWAAERGRQILDWGIDAPDFQSYMKRVGPGMYVDRWTTAYSGSNHVTFDEAGFCDWLASLVDRGIIAAPELDALEILERSLVQAIDSAGEMAASLPEQYRGSRAAVVERLAADLDVVRAALDGVRGEAEPAPDEYDTPEEA